MAPKMPQDPTVPPRTDPFARPETPVKKPGRLARILGDGLQNKAYRCYLTTAACVTLFVLGDALGRTGILPQPLAAGLLVFLLWPIMGLSLLSGMGGIGLTLAIRRDPRLWALALLTIGVGVFWVRRQALGDIHPLYMLIYSAGALLFSTHWLLKQRGARP